MTTENSIPVVSFPAQHASQTLMDLVVIARSLGGFMPIRIQGLNRYLPETFRRRADDLTEVFTEVRQHVQAGTFEELGKIGGENTRHLLEDVAAAVVRRAAATLRDINAMFERGDSPTVVDKSVSWGRFGKDLLCVAAILGCTNQPARDEKGMVKRDGKGQVIKLRGIFLAPHVFTTRKAYDREIAEGISPKLGYLDGLEQLANLAGEVPDIAAVLTQIRAITRSGKK